MTAREGVRDIEGTSIRMGDEADLVGVLLVDDNRLVTSALAERISVEADLVIAGVAESVLDGIDALATLRWLWSTATFPMVRS